MNWGEYDGYWSFGKMCGEGVFTEASTGRIERRLIYNNKNDLLEVIEEGH
jgi:hypothetical protein